MTPEERRTRAEYVAKLAEQGILAEPSYDREAWQAQEDREAPTTRKAAKARTGNAAPTETEARPGRRTA